MKTSYSRRELYAFGEPIGESSTYKLAGRRVYGGGGGVLGSIGNALGDAVDTVGNLGQDVIDTVKDNPLQTALAAAAIASGNPELVPELTGSDAAMADLASSSGLGDVAGATTATTGAGFDAFGNPTTTYDAFGNPAAASGINDATAADNIDVGGGWNPATGAGDAATAAAAAETGVTSSAGIPYGASAASGLGSLLGSKLGGSGLTLGGGLLGGAGLAALLNYMKADSSRYGVPGRQDNVGSMGQFKYNPALFNPTTPNPADFRPAGISTAKVGYASGGTTSYPQDLAQAMKSAEAPVDINNVGYRSYIDVPVQEARDEEGNFAGYAPKPGVATPGLYGNSFLGGAPAFFQADQLTKDENGNLVNRVNLAKPELYDKSTGLAIDKTYSVDQGNNLFKNYTLGWDPATNKMTTDVSYNQWHGGGGFGDFLRDAAIGGSLLFGGGALADALGGAAGAGAGAGAGSTIGAANDLSMASDYANAFGGAGTGGADIIGNSSLADAYGGGAAAGAGGAGISAASPDAAAWDAATAGEYGGPAAASSNSGIGSTLARTLGSALGKSSSGGSSGSGLTMGGGLLGGAGLGALLNYMKADSAHYGVPGRQDTAGPMSQFKYNPAGFAASTPAPRAMNEPMGMVGYAGGGQADGSKPKYTSRASLASMNPWQRAQAELGNAAYQAQMPTVSQMPAAGVSLGQLNLASGGLSDLGGYSDGGRLLRGPGDGVSDSIPATIGHKQPARLADGEFVVPARIVSELGNGSTEAGARKLYAMMDRIQAGRKKSIGKDKVAVNSRADKYLPK